MAIKRKLSEMIVPRDNETVHIHVPPTDLTDDVVRASEALVNTVTHLKDERDELRRLNEQLNRKCVFLAKVNDRIEGELDRCRKQTNEYIRRNGKLVGMRFDELEYQLDAAGEIVATKVLREVLLPCDDVVPGFSLPVATVFEI